MKTLKFGFIGAGFISLFHASAMKHVRGVELAGVYALKGSERLQAYVQQNELGECAIYPNVAELCKNVDVVAVLAPNNVRIELVSQILEAVQAGAALKGIICEKPLGRTVAEARQLVELGRKSGVPLSYFENQNHMKSLRAQLAQLEPVQKVMGPLFCIRSSEEHSGPHEGWFWDPTRQGGGVLSDMACHSIASAWYALTPIGKPLNFLKPVAVSADTSLLKWGLPKYKKVLLDKFGVDYDKTPAEDFATGIITYQNPETGQLVKGQFSNSWMYDKQGMRLYAEGLGPGYGFEMNTQDTPSTIFIGDEAAESAANVEAALEKSTATRGQLLIEPNEADLYGYVDEIVDARASFLEGKDAMLSWEYGLEITKLCQAAYMAAEQRKTLDLTCPNVQKELENYVSLIAQGRGAEVLYR